MDYDKEDEDVINGFIKLVGSKCKDRESKLRQIEGFINQSCQEENSILTCGSSSDKLAVS